MDPYDLLHGRGKHAEGVVLPEVVLGRERKRCEVVQVFDVIWMHARCVEFLSVVGHALIGEANGLPEPRELEVNELILARLLDRLDLVECAHKVPSLLASQDKQLWLPLGDNTDRASGYRAV